MFLDEGQPKPLSIETRLPRAEMAPPILEDEGKAAIELAAIMTTASNPVSPGPSSPPLDQARMQDFVPPTRPSSTPFPQPEHRNADILCVGCPADDQVDLDEPEASAQPVIPPSTELAETNFNDLPPEIHECILDHLFGVRVSTASKNPAMRWGTGLRHPRRKELSELSRVSPTWRVLVQQRLYRHIKLKAAVESINESFTHFTDHPRLRSYVKHIEVWFPVFQPKYTPLALASANTLPTVTVDGLTNASYVLPEDNCSLDEAFYFISSTFPEVCILTLEGGERKKAPEVKHWIRVNDSRVKSMPKINSIRTLICKGQWNLIRSDEDFKTITSALPNLQNWQGSYGKPKAKSYLTMSTILPKLPRTITNLNICIEGDYRRETSFPPYFLRVMNNVHFCMKLAEAVPALEHISYTGRVCRTFFDRASLLVDPRTTRLKSIDLTVKNCCRHVSHWNESGSGITDMNFIRAFENLVLAGIRSLGNLKAVEYLRIRFVDLGMFIPAHHAAP